MRKLAILALTFLILSCGDDAVGPDRLSPDSRADGISDANHGTLEDRNPGFWWLPPMVPNPTVDGAYQAAASPRVVLVCRYSSLGDPCDPNQPLVNAGGAAAEFTRGAGLVAGADHFQVNVDTRAWGLRTTSIGDTTTYRLIVYTEALEAAGGPFEMGSADFQLGENGGTAKNLAMPDSMIALTDGRTLPVKFYLNEHAYAHELAIGTEPAGELALCQENCSVTFLPPSEDSVEASLSDEEGAKLTAVLFPPMDETRVLIIDERKTEGAEANCAPGRVSTKTACFRFELTGGALAEEFRFGVCPEGVTFGQGVWQLTQVKEDGTAIPHGDVDVSDFLPCEGRDGSGSGPISMLLDLIVRPLYAEDTRVWGGRAEDFSDFFWEIPAEMSSSNAPSATTAPGQTETFNVLVVATHGVEHGHDPLPLGGVGVTFAVTEGTGTLGSGPTAVTTQTVSTDANGLASATMTFGGGQNTLVVSSSSAAGGPISFTRTASTQTETVLSQDAQMSEAGSTTMLEAFVYPAPPAGSTVGFFQGPNQIGTAPTTPDGTAFFQHTLGSSLEPETFTALFFGAPGFEASGSGPLTRHKYQVFSDLTSFSTALGDSPTDAQDFSDLTVGTPVSELIPGVLTATSSFENLEVSQCSGDNCLFGFDGTTRQAGNGRYGLEFAAARNALSFDITAQNPNTAAATVRIFTSAGPLSLDEVNETGDETLPNFFGIILTLPIDSAVVVEPPEVTGTGSEEVGLDNVLVGYTLGTILEVDLSATTLTIGTNTPYTASILNGSGEPLTNVTVQGVTWQGTTHRAAGGTGVDCGAGVDVVPPGECVVEFVFVVSNTTSGSGTLVPGPAEAVIQLSTSEGLVHEVRVPVILQ